MIPRINAAEDIEELFNVSGRKSFFVTTTSASLARPGYSTEGTRITLQTSVAPEGYDFFINSPVSRERDNSYALDMDFTFNRFIEALRNVMKIGGKAESDYAFARMLEVFYYWVIYAPLSRGTSATGYAALMACVVATGEEILDPVPKGKQLDWEGIFTLHPEEFSGRISAWFPHRGPSSISKDWLDATPGHKVREIFNTTRNMLAVLGALE